MCSLPPPRSVVDSDVWLNPPQMSGGLNVPDVPLPESPRTVLSTHATEDGVVNATAATGWRTAAEGGGVVAAPTVSAVALPAACVNT